MIDITERLHVIRDQLRTGALGQREVWEAWLTEAVDEMARLRTDIRGYQQDIFHLQGRVEQNHQLAAEIERLRQDSAELDRLTIQWNEAREERLAEIERGDDKRWGKALTDAIPDPSPEQEIKHLAEQCATLLRENERLRALSGNNAHSWDAIVRERDELRALGDKLWTEHLIEREDLKLALIKATAEIAQLKAKQ